MHSPEILLELSLNGLAALFGTSTKDLASSCMNLLEKIDLRYRKLSRNHRDQLILNILKKIDSNGLSVSGEGRKPDWEMGWLENLRDFIQSGYDPEKLVPKYFKKNVPVRLNGDYVMPVNPDFVLNCTKIFRSWLFKKYLQDAGSIYEFGCGSATHLAFLASLYPDKKIYGLDWAKPSQEIIRLLAGHYGWKIEGRSFDFFAPDPDLHLDPNSTILTFGGLEQVGNRHKAFLEYLLHESPALCINIECIEEFYDPNHLPDYLALKYHKRRGYLSAYLTRLQELEKSGFIEILKVHHQKFGNLFNDSHSYIIWKVKKRNPWDRRTL